MKVELFLKICGEAYKFKTPSLRWGQTLSLLFSRHFPGEKIPNDIDPYYEDQKINPFLDYILEM